jgi:hypothetical protein
VRFSCAASQEKLHQSKNNGYAGELIEDSTTRAKTGMKYGINNELSSRNSVKNEK